MRWGIVTHGCEAGKRSGREGERVARRDGKLLPGVTTTTGGLDAATVRAARLALAGERRGLRGVLPFLGPAFVASIAYMDPGNFATNIASGARYGYLLLWVILVSNLMAMFVQTLSAKLGIATGRNLAEVCRDEFPRAAVVGLWLQAEVIAIATDLAEFLGAALGFHLLFGIALFPAALLTGVTTFAILGLQR